LIYTLRVINLQISFDDNDSGLNKVLAIEGIYQTQNDIVAELIIKSEIYNETYRKSLEKSFQKLYGNGKMNINFNRIIIGNYVESNEIHKRPMSKFMQDIARQLDIID